MVSFDLKCRLRRLWNRNPNGKKKEQKKTKASFSLAENKSSNSHVSQSPHGDKTQDYCR